MIFKRVGDSRPYPPHDLTSRAWAALPPRQVRLDELITTKDTLHLDALLDEDSTFYGDLFPHAVRWEGETYLEDGLHRALRAALQQRFVIHVRVLSLDALRAESRTATGLGEQAPEGGPAAQRGPGEPQRAPGAPIAGPGPQVARPARRRPVVAPR